MESRLSSLFAAFVLLLILSLLFFWHNSVEVDVRHLTEHRVQDAHGNQRRDLWGADSADWATHTAANRTTGALKVQGSLLPAKNSRGSCQPVTNFVFIKVHKTGSASTAMILERFAWNHDLTLCHPRDKKARNSMRLTFPHLAIDQSVCVPAPGRPYNVIVHHTVYNRRDMDRLMAPGTRYIGIMRHPLSHLRSIFFYFKHPDKFELKGENPLATYLDNPEHYDGHKLKKGKFYTAERNFQVGVLGFPVRRYTEDSLDPSQVIPRIKQEFALVIINEYYDESLVLLRRILCWTMYDILHTTSRKNEQTDKRKDLPLTKAQMEQHRAISPLDYEAYDFCNRTFWEKISEEGEGFWEEVRHFKTLNSQVNRHCEEKSVHKVIPASQWNTEFVVDNKLCVQLAMPPKDAAAKLLQRHMEKNKQYKT